MSTNLDEASTEAQRIIASGCRNEREIIAAIAALLKAQAATHDLLGCDALSGESLVQENRALTQATRDLLNISCPYITKISPLRSLA